MFFFWISGRITVVQARTGALRSCTFSCLFHNYYSFVIIMEQTRKSAAGFVLYPLNQLLHLSPIFNHLCQPINDTSYKS